MKSTALILTLLALCPPLSGQDTAYQALHILAERKGTQALENVYIIRGLEGEPQPEKWIVYRGRPNARVFQTTEIRGDGSLTSGKASTRDQGLQPDALPLNLSVLNLDTHAAWKIAQRHARKERFHFTFANYELTTHPLARVPAWTLYLFNETPGVLGIMTLSGATGEVLNRLKIYHYTTVEPGEGTRGLVIVREPQSDRVARSISRWFSLSGEAYGHDLLNAGGTTEELLINRRTRHFSKDAR